MKFQVIKGGKYIKEGSYRFVSGAVTDTRLMGVLGLYLHWIDDSMEDAAHLHQYLYYDIEEIGLDSLTSYSFDDEASALIAQKTAFGGLGASMVPVSEREGRYLVQSFVEETKRKKQPLPLEADQLDFILRDPVELTEEELKELNKKICVDIKTDFGTVNYFLMREYGKDFEGAELLKKEGVSEDAIEDLSLPKHATFLQNSIEVYEDEDGNVSYLSESLTESQNSYFITISEITVDEGKVSSAKNTSRMSISTHEASLKLNREEFVCVFEINVDMDEFDLSFDTFSMGTTKTIHDTGDMFMEFKPDNSHVERRLFKLSDDVFAIYYVTDFGQIIMGAYDPFSTVMAEAKLTQFFKDDISCTGRYRFAQSVVYEFALSGFEDFDDFVSRIQDQ